jgi:hypothetical protein
MIIELNGSYGVVTFKVKNADGSYQEVPNVDVFKLRDELAEAPVQREDEVLPDGSVKKQSTEEEMSAIYMAVLAKYGIKDTGSTLPGIFISNEVVAAKDLLLKKFDANAEVSIVD